MLLMLVLVFAVFGNTFFNEWTYDDIPVVVENPDVKSLEGFFENSYTGRPLRELSYMVDYKLFGTDSTGYRLQQLLWHAANGFLLFLLFCRLGIRPLYALLGTGLFLVHPIQVESVASIGHRKELLPLFFALAGVLAYRRVLASQGRRRWLWLGAVVALYALVFYANITAVTFPLLLVLYEYLFIPREERLLLRAPKVYLPVGASLAAGLVYVLFRGYDFQKKLMMTYSQNGFLESKSYLPLLLSSFKSFATYLGKIVWPLDLAPEYVVEMSAEIFRPGHVVGFLLAALMVFAFFFFRRREPRISFGIGWFLTLYLPIANLVPAGGYLMADRYMYLCLPGVALVGAAILQSIDRRAATAIFCLALLILGGLTVRQNTVWRDSYSLWQHAAAVNPDSTGANWSFAQSLIQAGEFERAKEHIGKVLEINRFFVPAYLSMAKIEQQLGNLEEAIDYYEQFIRYGSMTMPQEAARIKMYLPMLKRQLQGH